MGNRTDDFNRADSSSSLGTPSDGGTGYTISSGTWGIASNQGRCVSSTAQSIAYTEASAANADVQVTLTTISTDIGVVCRVVDSNNYILGTATGGSGYRLYKRVAGSFTQLGSTSVNIPANGEVLKLTLNGSSLTLYSNGVSRVAATDSAHSTATKHGLRANSDTSSRFDDFSVTDLSAGGAAVSLLHGLIRSNLTQGRLVA